MSSLGEVQMWEVTPTKAETTIKRYNTARLKGPETSKKFTLTLKNKLQVLCNIGNGMEAEVETIWKTVKESF